MAQEETQMDMPLSMLSKVLKVKPGDLFFLEQSGEAKALTAQVLETWLLEMAEGHGGVVDFQKTGTSGLKDTYAFTMSDATQFSFTVKNGERGPRGFQGPTGAAATLTSNTIEYASSTSGSTHPSSGWSASVPNVPQGHYLWSRSKIQFNSGSPAYIYSASRMGIDGSGTVNSVNGKTGIVNLTAVDIGGFLDKTYPVGAVYISFNDTSPASLFGGTWEQIKDRFLLAAGDTYAAGTTGGTPDHNHALPFLSESSETANFLFAYWNSWDYVGKSHTILNYNDLNSTPTGSNATGYEVLTDWHSSMPPYLAVYIWKRTA